MRRRSPATARTRAVEVLRAVLEKGRSAAPLIGRRAVGLSPADQDLLRELVLGVLRWKAALDAEIAASSRVPFGKLAPNLRETLEVALYQLRHLDRVPAYAAVSEAVDHARSSGGEGAARLVNGILRSILLLPAPSPPSPLPSPPLRGERGSLRATAPGPPLPAGEGRGEGRSEAEELATYYSHPSFLVARWLERFGPERTRRILVQDNSIPFLDLLVNPRRTTRERLRSALAAENVTTELSPLAPLALTVLSGNPLRSRLLTEGHFSVQDVGSQLLPLLLPPGERLVDLAAAPGGKSLAALAAGRFRESLAVDRSLERLVRVRENVHRLRIPAIRPVGGDLGALPLPEGRFERVLLDAPCSGTGTLRKNPEIRYRIRPDAIERLARAQQEALLAAARLLAPGGFLLYATCSLEEEENERVVERVLERDSGVEPAAIEAPPVLSEFIRGERVRLFPDERTDGFTAHLLRRRSTVAAPGPQVNR